MNQVTSGTYNFAPSVILYQAVNQINGKRYVGLTEKGFVARKMKHLANAKRGQSGKFYTAIRKYGAENFIFEELITCYDYWDGLEKERQFIVALRPEYNLTAGGGGVKGLKFSIESRAKMSAAKKGKKGHPCPEWVKLKNAELRRAERGIIKHPSRYRAVYSITDDLVFESVKAAASHYSTHPAQIIYWASGGKSRRGLKFKYLKESA
jgi:hypothetical protein